MSGGSGIAPAIAIDAVGAQVFIPQYDGVHAYHLNGAYLGDTNLGGAGLCSGPVAAHTRPNSNPPIIDVTCIGTDGNAYLTYLSNGSYGAWNLVGSPPVGIRAGSAPAVVSTDATAIQLVVVGNDGSAWLNTGAWSLGYWLGWMSLGGTNFQSVAVASYAPTRIDVVAIDSNNGFYHRGYDGDWWPAWQKLVSTWSTSVPPFAASYPGHLGHRH